MRTKVLLGLAVALMLVVGVATIGSNMGFKISIPLAAGGASNWVSIPYYNSYTDATSIYNDVPGATQVSRWDNPTGSIQTWTGRGTNFAVTPGEAYVIKVSAPTNWIVVGSHNPSLSLSLAAGGASNWVSVPYHATATDASTLFTQLGANVTQVSRWDNPTGSIQTWTGRGTNFALTPGEAVVIKVGSVTPWTPAHY
jgi:hypothetical protein